MSRFGKWLRRLWVADTDEVRLQAVDTLTSAETEFWTDVPFVRGTTAHEFIVAAISMAALHAARSPIYDGMRNTFVTHKLYRIKVTCKVELEELHEDTSAPALDAKEIIKWFGELDKIAPKERKGGSLNTP